MNSLHLPDNIKVHFAGIESKHYLTSISEMGVSYALYSAFPFVYKKIFGRQKNLTFDELEIPRSLASKMKHVIQDSGLFSLLYGAKRDLADKSTVFKWYDSLVEYTLEHGANVTCVEVDCQDILGDRIAWDLRERLRTDLPNNRIINVFHLSDGVKGLDRLIEFSDYIGVGSGDPRNSSSTMFEVSSYIKHKNPSTDIHLLGCTALKTIKKCNFATSCDSISWKSPLRFGFIDGYHISDLSKVKVRQLVGDETYSKILEHNSDASTTAICASIELVKRQYQRFGGNQDYTKFFDTL